MIVDKSYFLKCGCLYNKKNPFLFSPQLPDLNKDSKCSVSYICGIVVNLRRSFERCVVVEILLKVFMCCGMLFVTAVKQSKLVASLFQKVMQLK